MKYEYFLVCNILLDKLYFIEKMVEFSFMETVYFKDVNTKNLAFIKHLLENGGIIGFPTETVYGLGASVSDEEAIKKIYSLKNRPIEKALTVHVGSLDHVYLVAEDLPEDFFLLQKSFLPGPLTIVLKKRSSISKFVSSFDTVAIRMPSHPAALKFLKVLKEPIIGTSANYSSCKDPISADEVSNYFHDKIDCIIDGGICDMAIPSTVLNLVGEYKILRKGPVSQEQIEKILNRKILSV